MTLTHLHVRLILLTIVMSVLMYGTQTTHAATGVLSCEFDVTTKQGSVTTSKATSILLKKGESFELKWKSSNADSAENKNGINIALSGTVTRTPKTDASYTYYFFQGNKKVSCKVSVKLATGSVDKASLTTKATQPKIFGTASGVQKVYFTITKKDDESVIFTSKLLKVKNGTWSSVVTKKLKNGPYDVTLYGEKKFDLHILSTDVLSVGTQKQSSGVVSTTLVVEPIPLLVGGTVRGGGLVPFSYLQVINVGTQSAKLKGFTITQKGNASVNSILSLSSVDDTGLLQSSIDGVAGSKLFKNGTAFIPTESVLLPGAMHLFTLKVALVANTNPYILSQLKLSVDSVVSNAKSTKGLFPVRGVTWTITQ